VHDAARTIYGAPRSGGTYKTRVTPTIYRDCYRGQAHGREFMTANGWTSIVELRSASVCQLRLGWFLGEPAWIEPARYVTAMAGIRQITTGDPAFDRQFRVHAAHARTVAELLGADARALIMARDDWFFAFGGADLLCVCPAGYRSPGDVHQARLTEWCRAEGERSDGQAGTRRAGQGGRDIAGGLESRIGHQAC
jgi:hypothetical protein